MDQIKFWILALITVVTAGAETAHASCVISGNAAGNGDYLARRLATLSSCPNNVFQLRASFVSDGMQLRTTLVANRGFHNPSQGSFSLFELLSGRSQSTPIRLDQGQFFFGHFTAAQGSQLVADQNPTQGALMVELIAWDFSKKVFNFYELIGDGTQGRWFYRGDSHDIQRDLRFLHLQPNPGQPQFGQTLRCAGCHMNGGPIMKELEMPHNDWWMPERILDSGGRVPDPALADVLKTLVPAEALAQSVKTGVIGLHSSGVQATLSLREKLRPLFCPMEINFESDLKPSDSAQTIRVASGFFVDPRLARVQIAVSKSAYDAGMRAQGMRFPETHRTDGDHAFLTPVKAFSDMMAVENLRKSGLVDDEFITDILAIDLTNPVVSPARCGLLRLVPESESGHWREQFATAIKNALAQATAVRSPWAPVLNEAFTNLMDPARNAAFHRARANRFLQACSQRASVVPSVAHWIQLLAQRRAEVRASEISKNPRGQILEPGFRVIFPEPTIPSAPGKLRLDESCELSQFRTG
ncbi:MAG: hypothetical protein ACJ763_19070 [Bdellovibrionia bacterium]